ncbi:MAG TPA: DnaD domain protein [Clostridia bacterium]|nr:DnaD domain protein [Clostridia bacterium]
MIKKRTKKRTLKQYKEGNVTAAFGNDLITSGTTTIPNLLLKIYKHMGIKDNEMILLIQLFRLKPEERRLSAVIGELTSCLNTQELEIENTLNSLVENGLLGITRYYDEGSEQIYEGFDFEPLFDKLSEMWACSKVKDLEHVQQLLEGKDVETKVSDINDPKVSRLFTAFEEEFGRPLSPIEIDQIRLWFKETDLTLIMEALRRAVLRGKHNFKYIDHILLNWKKNNIRTINEILEKDHYAKKSLPIRDKPQNDKNERKRALMETLYLS